MVYRTFAMLRCALPKYKDKLYWLHRTCTSNNVKIQFFFFKISLFAALNAFTDSHLHDSHLLRYTKASLLPNLWLNLIVFIINQKKHMCHYCATFAPQCYATPSPHCAAKWKESRSILLQIKATWYIVSESCCIAKSREIRLIYLYTRVFTVARWFMQGKKLGASELHPRCAV